MEVVTELKLLKQNFQRRQSSKKPQNTFERVQSLHFVLHSNQKSNQATGAINPSGHNERRIYGGEN